MGNVPAPRRRQSHLYNPQFLSQNHSLIYYKKTQSVEHIYTFELTLDSKVTQVSHVRDWVQLQSFQTCVLHFKHKIIGYHNSKFVHSVMMSIYSADNILWCCQCQWLPFERPQHERTARWYQNRKRQMRQKIRKYIFKLLQSLNLSLFTECPFKGKLIEVCVWFWFWKI